MNGELISKASIKYNDWLEYKEQLIKAREEIMALGVSDGKKLMLLDQIEEKEKNFLERMKL